MKQSSFILSATLFSALLATSCSNSESNSNIIEITLSDKFPTTVSAPDSAVSVNSIINIENWNMGADNILAQSKNTDRVFYRLDPATFCTVDSFGVIGQGPDEYIFPKIVRTTDGDEILADIGKNRFFGSSREIITQNNGNLLYNSPFSINYPIIGFTHLAGDDRVLYVYDLDKSAVIDSIAYRREEQPVAQAPLNFRAASDGRRLVIVREFSDEITIVDLDGNSRFEKTKRLKGNGMTSPMKPYYVGVECGADRFYVLSMKNATFGINGELDGNSSIDIYDYEGNPIASIALEIFPRQILLDTKHNRILALNSTDDDIHIIPLNM